jgi:hypothetical protein
MSHQPSTLRNLLDNFLELRAEDVHASIVVKVSPERDV